MLDLGDGVVRMLDQTRLPGEVVHITCGSWQEVAEAIRGMVVRGAPAIGIAGAMGVALAAQHADHDDPAAHRVAIEEAVAALRVARPTAVNLAWAVDRQRAIAEAHPGPTESLTADLRLFALRLHRAEVARCRAMGRHALPLVHRGARILTHCNAGALATGGYGSALGVVRAAHAADPSVRGLVDETRPLLQGARLTAWELAQDGIPHTLIADNMAAAFMAQGGVTHVVVGADRIAANGDVVNKIGTYGLAVLAREHGIPFIVAAPSTTIDPGVPSAAHIPVEERAAEEVRDLHLLGRPAVAAGTVVANPAFDRTPARLVTAIVTEHGVHRPPYERSLAGVRPDDADGLPVDAAAG
ncbi:MAG: S-methyl-5-thioribose-1-phosphate isomerase [Thermoleophilia bacterium]